MPSAFTMWKKSLGLFLLFTLTGLLLYAQGWWWLTILFVAFGLFMAFWTSPLRRGLHTPFSQCDPERAIVIWAPWDKGSSQLQVAIRSTDERIAWVNYVHDAEARAFAAKHGGVDALPVVIVGRRVLTNATSGAVFDALDGTSADPAGQAHPDAS